MKSTIGRKITLAFLVLLTLMLVIVGITSQGFDKVISSLDTMEHETVKRGASGNLRFAITQLLMGPNDYIITEKEYYHREYNRHSSRADDFYRQFIQLQLTEEEQQLVGQIKQDLDSIRAYSAQIFSIQHPRQSPKAWALMEVMDYRFGNDVNLKTTEIFDGISKRIEQHRLLALANKKNATNLVYGVSFLCFVISLVVSYLIAQRISKPIVTVTKAANGIANGDYSLRPVVKTHDEIAVLAQSFSRMAESLQQSQRALAESKRLTETIVATVPSGLLMFGSDGKILSVNNSFRNIFGLVPDVFINEYVEPVFKELGISEECRNHILAHEPVRDIECTHFDPAKGTRILNLTLLPIFLTDGESLLVVEDITKRIEKENINVQLTEQLRVKNKLLEQNLAEMKNIQQSLIISEKMASIGQLTAGIAHEINNPLAFVSSNLNRFQEYFDDLIAVLYEWHSIQNTLEHNVEYKQMLGRAIEAEQRVDVQFIVKDFYLLMKHTQDGTERIRKIVEQLRGFTHLANSELLDANINDALEDTLTLTWNELKYKAGIVKEYGVLPLVQCNVGELKQVFVNLLINAAHAIQEKGVIILQTFVKDNSIVIQIIDNGCGIPPEHLKKIFDPFFTTKPVGKGTGLGLWISATLIQKHHGTIAVESVMNEGTTFTITLPLRVNEQQGENE